VLKIKLSLSGVLPSNITSIKKKNTQAKYERVDLEVFAKFR